MKIVVIGGSGLIGTKLVALLRTGGHEVVAASPSTGVNTLTGEGLAQALVGADVVVDVANSPSFEDAAVLAFFQTSAANLLPAERAAGVKHHVALSVVGAERNPDSGYLRAKMAQEAAIRASSVPYTIVRATQFHEFVAAIVGGATEGTIARLPSAMMQPIAATDVAELLAGIVVAPPVNGQIELAGPEPIRMDELGRRWVAAKNEPRRVETDATARYFGAPLDDRSLTPDPFARLGRIRFDSWLAASVG